MFKRIRAGWSLTIQSLAVIKADTELLLFPLMSGISLIVVCASFLMPFFVSDAFREYFQTESSYQELLIFATVFLFYFINYFIIMFFNAGLVGCAIIRFDGGNPTLGDGFRIAMDRLPQIFVWALLSATIGLILKMIESSERGGQIIAAFLGLAWSITTYFVLPVLVVEKIGPIAAFKRSASILKNNWGEALTANIGIGGIAFLMCLLAFLPVILGFIIGTPASLVVGIALTAGGFILTVLIASATGTIITAALYEYAGNNRVPTQFDQHLLEQAFVTKSR